MAEDGPQFGGFSFLEENVTRPARSMHMDIVQREALPGSRYRITIAASEKVRQPPELDFEGLAFDNYLRNPVVMWAHDAVGRSPSGGLPIGRTLDLAKTPSGGVVAEFEFLSDDPFAGRVKNAWDKGFLQAASVSWLPLETTPTSDGGWRDTRSDLLEWSIVSVPADPDALRATHQRLLDDFLAQRESEADGLQSKDSDTQLIEIMQGVAALRHLVQTYSADVRLDRSEI